MKGIKVSDKVYEKLKKIRDELEVRSIDSALKILLGLNPKYADVTLRLLADIINEVKKYKKVLPEVENISTSSTKEESSGTSTKPKVEKHSTSSGRVETHNTTTTTTFPHTSTEGLPVRYEEDIPMDVYNYVVNRLTEIKKKYGKKKFSEYDFEKLRNEILEEMKIDVSPKAIINTLKNENLLKEVKGGYLFVG